MIKLNNKNITYVALADSNNSIKAPKEIWYADSNNSVKLVYRRKDALIEGEDYEKYHWLKGDGDAYINTLVSDLTNVDTITCYFYWYGDVSSDNRIFGRESPKSFTCGVNFSVSKLSIWIESPYPQLNLNNDEDYFEVDLVNQKISTSLQTSWISPITEITGTSFYLFGDHGYNKIFSGKIKNFIIGNKLNLIPCKLLKPLPKWLDANGIRRQVGECGMIDLVSGRFYGNVNNVGTFTVENYYERKEWLQGDGEAFINTLINPSFGDEISAEGIITSRPNIDNIAFISAHSGNDAFGLYTGGSYHKVGIPQYVILHTSSVLTEYIAFSPQEYGKFKMQCQLTQNSLPQYSLSIDNVDVQPHATNATINQVPTSSYRIGYLVVEGLSTSIGLDTCKLSKVTINSNTLIPCILTMDLPASMDANNIARTKGTSGMWDLVSDKFYGNVASSGTFKAVNLAEGVDYEVHQWLKCDGEAYIDTLVNKLKGTITVDIDSTAVTSNSNILGREAYPGLGYESRCVVNLLRQNNNYIADIYGIKTSSGYGVRIDSIDTLYLDLDTKIASTKSGNSTSIDIGTDIGGYNMLLFAKNNGSAPSSARWQGGIGNFKMADVINFIPVKLLKSIPSKYDANGIARQAGECGMYDTVNDVFYGNAASSGTFSVEDD